MTATAIGSYATTALLKGLIGTTDSDDDSLVGLICDRVNAYIESETKQPIAPITSATYLYDIEDYSHSPMVYPSYGLGGTGSGLKRLFAPTPVGATTLGIGGLRAISLLEFAPYTGGTYETIASTDYFLRGRHGVAGPFQWLVLSDRPAGQYYRFPAGRATVRVTATAGWTAIPDDLIQTALLIAQRDWNARSIGGQGTSEQGDPMPPLRVSNREREVIWNYRLKMPV